MFKISFGSVFVYGIFIPLLIFYHVIESYHFLPSEFKLVVYLTPLLGFIFYILYNVFYLKQYHIPLKFRTLDAILLYLVLCILSRSLSEEEFYAEGFWRDFIITSTALLFFALPIQFKPMNLYIMFVVAILCYLIWIEFSSDISILASVLVSNQFHVEYHFGTVSGIFLIYFIYKKKYFWLIPALLFMLLVNKRATVLGVICACFFFYGILKFFKLFEKPRLLFFVLLTYYLIFYVVAINLPFLVGIFLDLIDNADVQVDDFLMGRVILFDAIQPDIFNRGWLHYVFGNGIGQGEFHIWNSIYHEIYQFHSKPFLIHNDFVKLHFELGLAGVLLYFFIMRQLYCVSELGIFIFLSIVPLFLIDNTIIYSYNILVAAITSRIVSSDNLSLNRTFNKILKEIKNYLKTTQKLDSKYI